MPSSPLPIRPAPGPEVDRRGSFPLFIGNRSCRNSPECGSWRGQKTVDAKKGFRWWMVGGGWWVVKDKVAEVGSAASPPTTQPLFTIHHPPSTTHYWSGRGAPRRTEGVGGGGVPMNTAEGGA